MFWIIAMVLLGIILFIMGNVIGQAYTQETHDCPLDRLMRCPRKRCEGCWTYQHRDRKEG